MAVASLAKIPVSHTPPPPPSPPPPHSFKEDERESPIPSDETGLAASACLCVIKKRGRNVVVSLVMNGLLFRSLSLSHLDVAKNG